MCANDTACPEGALVRMCKFYTNKIAGQLQDRIDNQSDFAQAARVNLAGATCHASGRMGVLSP